MGTLDKKREHLVDSVTKELADFVIKAMDMPPDLIMFTIENFDDSDTRNLMQFLLCLKKYKSNTPNGRDFIIELISNPPEFKATPEELNCFLAHCVLVNTRSYPGLR